MPVAWSLSMVYDGPMRTPRFTRHSSLLAASFTSLFTAFFCTSLAAGLSAQAAELSISCDTGGVQRNDCTDLLKKSALSLGCSIKDVSCKTHPWGSDFTKSWICSGQSVNCQEVPPAGCPTGTLSVFKDGWTVCLKSSAKTVEFRGECRHQQASHSFLMNNCDRNQFSCVEFGGTPDTLSVKCKTNVLGSSQMVSAAPDCDAVKDQCTKLGGEVFGSWSLSCNFRDVIVPIQGASCDDLRERCERENSEKGAESKLLSCLPR
jgi:hypothetical protein